MREKVFCKNCVYSASVKDPSNVGTDTMLCTLNPPIPIVVTQTNAALIPGMGKMTSQLIAVFPPVARETFCHHGIVKGVS